MKTFARSILFAGTLVMGASGLMAAQTSNAWLDQWYKAKLGRPSPAEEARLKAERANTAFREETRHEGAMPSNAWFEQWYKAKFGRSSPAEEARQKAAKESTAFREEKRAEPKSSPTNEWFDQWYRAKYGRPAPVK